MGKSNTIKKNTGEGKGFTIFILILILFSFQIVPLMDKRNPRLDDNDQDTNC